MFAVLSVVWAMSLYSYLFQRNRNTEQSNDFEHSSDVRFEPVTGSAEKVDELRRTPEQRIPGDNLNDPRKRVARDPGVDS